MPKIEYDEKLEMFRVDDKFYSLREILELANIIEREPEPLRDGLGDVIAEQDL